MNKFIPYEKLSKKKKRELDAKKRGVWHINPVTRKPANSKAYNRRKVQKWDDPGSVPFLMRSPFGLLWIFPSDTIDNTWKNVYHGRCGNS